MLVNDSHRYLEYAQEIGQGHFFQEHNIWYFGYCAFLAVFLKTGASITYIILFQISLSILSILLLAKAGELLFKSQFAALVLGSLILLYVNISDWNFYILTESLFISFICLLLY